METFSFWGIQAFFFFESRIQAEASLPYSPAKFQNHSHTKPEALRYLLIRLEDDLESEAAHENPQFHLENAT